MRGQFLGTTPAQQDDAEELLKLSRDPAVKREFPGMRFNNIDEAKRFLERQIDISKTSGKYFFKAVRVIFDSDAQIYTEDNSIFIGFISLHENGPGDRLLTGFDQTLGFALSPSFRGRGIMANALKMVFNAMTNDGCNFVPALVKTENEASKKVLKKCGFLLLHDSSQGETFIKRLAMDEYEFKKAFNL